MKYEDQQFTAFVETNEERTIVSRSLSRLAVIQLTEKHDIKVGWTSPYNWKKEKAFDCGDYRLIIVRNLPARATHKGKSVP